MDLPSDLTARFVRKTLIVSTSSRENLQDLFRVFLAAVTCSMVCADGLDPTKMSTKPIFLATHPRACSTAFERVFMTRKDTLNCVHEPFGDAFYYGPERLSSRFDDDEDWRIKTGFNNSTYQTIFDHIDKQGSEGKRVFIKDIIHYLVPPGGQPASIAPSLKRIKRGVGTGSTTYIGVNGINGASSSHQNGETRYNTEPEPGNPTVVPAALLAKFHFTFLIRDPHSSIPSYYRCTIPPLDKLTGFYTFDPTEAGYDEVRRVFDYLRKTGQVGPHQAGGTDTDNVPKEVNGNTNSAHFIRDANEEVETCVVDADDLLDDPEGILKKFCKSVHLKYEPEMLNWDNEEDQKRARKAFEKWPGFHEDAIDSKDLKPRTHKKKAKSEPEWDAEWKEKYGEEAAKVIRETVDRNMEHYRYMKQFAIKI